MSGPAPGGTAERPWASRELDDLTALTALTGLASAHGVRYHMAAGDPPPSEADDWLPADRLLSPGTPELDRLLTAEYESSGHRTAHAAALTLAAVYAGRVTAAAVLQWALDGTVWDVRPHNVLVRPGTHGIAGVRLRVPAVLTAPARGTATGTATGAAADRRDAPGSPGVRGAPEASEGPGAPGEPDAPEASEGPGEPEAPGGPEVAEAPGPGGRSAALPALHEAVLHSHLLPLADALHRATRAGRRQLRGGVAHGCATALCAATRPGPAQLARRWREFTAPVPELARLGDVVEIAHADGSARLRYLRNTCCLFYTSAEAVRCASCCLTPREERVRAYAGRTGPTSR
ncbi:(2Fe-2S)-binding protein [Streptomyces sp. NRRL F-5053]|uniref:(2Fe-2S)-binding protein n=1 Tax=Streptomyces sp. NRRL F-5053 TaxID=1463854 RepID=UPI0006905E00|nr:(2Fe-2S)-binding protein [Streptomyces sp. NRRL F-5053]